MARRTTHRSSKGKKLYAVRNADGSFRDIQSYALSHAADLRQTSKAEALAGKKAAAKKKAKAAPKKKAAKKAAKKAVRKTAKRPAKKAARR